MTSTTDFTKKTISRELPKILASNDQILTLAALNQIVSVTDKSDNRKELIDKNIDA